MENYILASVANVELLRREGGKLKHFLYCNMLFPKPTNILSNASLPACVFRSRPIFLKASPSSERVIF